MLNQQTRTSEEWDMNRKPRSPEEWKAYLAQCRRYKTRCEHSLRIFLEETPGFVYDPAGRLSSQELYRLFKEWCMWEQLPLKSPREVFLYVKRYGWQYQLIPSNCILNADGKRVRGFRGLRRDDGTDGTHK